MDTPILAKTGDGKSPPEFLKATLASMTRIQPEAVAAAILDLVRDDSKAGATLAVEPEA